MSNVERQQFVETAKRYLRDIYSIAKHGDASEESYYKASSDFLDSFASLTRRKKICVTTASRRTEAGNPDFRVWDGLQHIVGYVEAKPLTVEHLEQIATTHPQRQ